MLKPTLSEVIDHIRDRTYMGGVERDQLRVKATGEVFTPTELVREILEQIPVEQFTDPNKTFLDNSCGDGQFLGEVLICKMENGSTFEQALSTIYGVDLMIDNVDECRKRLLCGSQDPKHIAIVEQNIYQANALKFSYKFEPMSDTRRKREQLHRRRAAKAKKAAEKTKKEQEFKDRANKLLGLAEFNVKSKKSSKIKEIQ
jgi:hypothetical protein